ncbi:hypothetical protein GCM10027413_04830 [Conyzicola nivalis]|uniref:Uncharacterized protein n=2 Tax=Conyzicola nivalis TaxID=1477021 RepID=A0A916SNZ5_9MICO|nr:hypothetical protein GCM10010979_21800 [Conyzicola nivalis]
MTVRELRLAVETGEPALVAHLLHADVAMLTDDGGGAATSEPRTVRGAADVARALCHLLDPDAAETTEREVNGRSALVLRRGGEVAGVVSLRVDRDLVTTIWVVLGRDKLRHWNDQPD